MTKAVIPYKLFNVNLLAENADFHSRIFYENRRALLDELRYLASVREIARKLKPDTVYKLVATPEGGKLLKDSSGNIKGVFYKGGKIIEHARFKAVQPSIIKAATTVGSQVLLINIAMQLNRIEKGISIILNEFHNDRISEVFAGVDHFHQAIMVQNKDRQSRMIEHAIQMLNSALEKTVRSLKMQIDNAPDPEISFWDNWFTNKSTNAADKFVLAEESFKACIVAAKTLAKCYSAIDEPYVAANTLIKSLEKIRDSGIELAAKKARLIPARANKFPEQPWLSFIERELSLVSEIKKCRLLANEEFKTIEIEVKPIELMES